MSLVFFFHTTANFFPDRTSFSYTIVKTRILHSVKTCSFYACACIIVFAVRKLTMTFADSFFPRRKVFARYFFHLTGNQTYFFHSSQCSHVRYFFFFNGIKRQLNLFRVTGVRFFIVIEYC